MILAFGDVRFVVFVMYCKHVEAGDIDVELKHTWA